MMMMMMMMIGGNNNDDDDDDDSCKTISFEVSKAAIRVSGNCEPHEATKLASAAAACKIALLLANSHLQDAALLLANSCPQDAAPTCKLTPSSCCCLQNNTFKMLIAGLHLQAAAVCKTFKMLQLLLAKSHLQAAILQLANSHFQTSLVANSLPNIAAAITA